MEKHPIDRDDLFALLRAERAYHDTAAENLTCLAEGMLVAQRRLDSAAAAWADGTDDVTPIHRLFRAAGLILQTLELFGGPLLEKAFSDMDFARANSGFVIPREQAKFLWPALDAIRRRMAGGEPDESHIAAQIPDHDLGLGGEG